MQDYCYPIQIMRNEIVLPKVTIQIDHNLLFLPSLLFLLWSANDHIISRGRSIDHYFIDVRNQCWSQLILKYPGGYLYLA